MIRGRGYVIEAFLMINDLKESFLLKTQTKFFLLQPGGPMVTYKLSSWSSQEVQVEIANVTFTKLQAVMRIHLINITHNFTSSIVESIFHGTTRMQMLDENTIFRTVLTAKVDTNYIVTT
jgi:hypothetical protein